MGGGGVTATVGVIGGGQLARMTQQAAISLGVRLVVLAEDASAPAIAAGADLVAGRPDVLADLEGLAARCDVVTVDHEQAPADLLAQLAQQGHRVAPGADAARLGQDKVAARAALGAAGIAVAPWTVTAEPDALARVADEHGWPLVLKAPRGGYDGRGVWVVHGPRAASQVLSITGGSPLLVEPHLPFSHELAIMVVRSWSGEVVAYPPLETVQDDGQCREVLFPASVRPEVATRARQLAVRIAETVGLVGSMAVELFVVDDRLLLNELAVRPHNSAHLTIEACATSQFENHLRAVLDLPLGATDAIVPAACMVNVVGLPDGSDPFRQLDRALAVPGASVHRYGKGARPGRKVGHVTATGADLSAARETATRAGRALGQLPSVAA